MIIKYDFLSKISGEILEVEVNNELGMIIKQLELDEFNLNRKETRRHEQLSVIDPNGTMVAVNGNILDDMLKNELHKQLHDSIEKLNFDQKELLLRVYINGEKQKDIAKSLNISERAVSGRLKTIYKKIEKFLKNKW